MRGSLFVIGDTVACEFNATTLAHTRSLPLPGSSSQITVRGRQTAPAL